ncbi:restriction endonuclease subunit S [Aliivibrio kagoshimensis]|uniref:restriction endonuclease subunit S n=1 Tax=Aliivibrio kagoshimensis TaxID=2910230 RepID=UPI003D0B9885
MSAEQTSMNQLITDNIDTWTSTVKTKSAAGRGSSKKRELYGVKKLRELILELAVRGKLVPQDPTDEPASVLLERIAAEKAQLVKDKIISRTKALPALLDGDIPNDLPKGWSMVRLGNLTSKLGSGSTPRGGKNVYTTEGIPFLRSQNVRNEGIKLDDIAYIPVEVHQKMDKTKVIPSDVLLNITGASLGRSTVFPESLVEANVSQHVTIIRLIERQMSQFVHLGILSPMVQRLVWGRQVGMAIEGLSKKVLEMFEFPVPPLKEQHRIVAKVDELMSLCDQLEQQTEASIEAHQVLVTTLLDTLTNSADADELMQNWARISEHFDTLFTTEASIDQLKQAILQLAVMGKLIPFGETKETTLKSILTFGPRNGFSPKEVPSETNVKVLKLGATSYGELNVEQSKFVDVDVSDKPHLYLTKGDILIQRGNSANFVGSNVLIQESYSSLIYPDLMMKLRVNEEILPKYASLVLSSKQSREHMWRQMTGTSGTMPKISKKVVEGVPVFFPVDLVRQKLVIDKYDEQIDICDQLKSRLKESQTTQLHLTDAIVEQAV